MAGSIAIEELRSLRETWSNYHNHKESVSYTAVAAIFTVGAYYITAEKEINFTTSMGYVMSLLFGHIFLRIQLIRRSHAAIVQLALSCAINNLEFDTETVNKEPKDPGKFKWILKYFLPMSSQHYSDYASKQFNRQDFLPSYAYQIWAFSKKPCYSHSDSFLVSATSFVILLLAIARCVTTIFC